MLSAASKAMSLAGFIAAIIITYLNTVQALLQDIQAWEASTDPGKHLSTFQKAIVMHAAFLRLVHSLLSLDILTFDDCFLDKWN